MKRICDFWILFNHQAILLITLLQTKGYSPEEVKNTSKLEGQKYYQGYPGHPEILSSHIIEQSPGLGHPFLPGHETNIDLNNFLWTGDISSDEIMQSSFEDTREEENGFSVTQKIYPDIPMIKPTSVLVTRQGTVYTTLIQPTPVFVPFGSSTAVNQYDIEGSGGSYSYPTHDPPSSHSQPYPYYESDRTHGSGYQYTNGYYDMPEPKFLIRTVLKNDTDLLRSSVNLQAFKVDMEERLTRTYRQAYQYLEETPRRFRRAVLLTDFSNNSKTYVYHGRVARAAPEKDNVKVRIHNIRSARPEPEIEILYAVYEDEKEPILATEAVQVINNNVNQDEVVLLLGHPLKIQAEPYLQEKLRFQNSSSDWLIASVLIAVFLAILLCWILFYIYKQYWGGKKKHDILISSAGTSKHASPSAPRKEMCEDGAYTLDRGHMRRPNVNVGRERLPSDKSDVSDRKDESGGETPSLADHSGNTTPAGTRKTKMKGAKRRERRLQRRAGAGLTTSDESEQDSAFPARTPENIKALDDLLEEEVPVPGDSGRGSIYPGHPGWAFLDAPDKDGDWQKTSEQVQRNADMYRETFDDTLPVESVKRKAKSAKSHIFRKDRVAAEVTEDLEGAPTRPWSATEPRWNADRMFSTKQKNWEGLAAGRKHLHHGQLLPGSTESTDEDGPRKTCWSEGASPGRPPPPASMAQDPATPLIQAIRSELKRFQRSQNSGVTIVNDPDILDRESKA